MRAKHILNRLRAGERLKIVVGPLCSLEMIRLIHSIIHLLV